MEKEGEEDQPENDTADANFCEAVCCYISDARSYVSKGVQHRSMSHVVDAAMVDTGSLVITTVGEQLAPTVIAASLEPTNQDTR